MGTLWDTAKFPAQSKGARGPVGHEPTPAQRAAVAVMRANGATIANCARTLGISPNTLTKHYALELDYGYENIRNRIGQVVVQKALSGDFKAAKFWLETQGGWGRATSQSRGSEGFDDPAPQALGSSARGCAALPAPGERHAGMTLGIGDNTIVVREAEQRDP